MNKYEEALSTINHYYVDNQAPKSLALLQVLVKLATPMKPINKRNILGGLGGECVCGKATVFDTHNYCWYCGQALDWSKEHE